MGDFGVCLITHTFWFHEAHLESSTSNAQDAWKADAPESSGNSNPTATLTNPLADQMETLIVETSIPSISDTNGVEDDLSNMENNISASPTPTFRIHKDHPKKPKKIFDALKDPSWVEAMQEELLQFEIQNVWSLVDCPEGVRPIGTKWVLKNKKNERGIVIKKKARLVAHGHTQEEGIDYKEVFAPVARIEAIRLFLAHASFIGFTDPEFPARDYKVEKAMYGLRQAPRAWLFNTPMDKENPWGKDETSKDVDLHIYRSMIGSLMYLTASRPDIMFDVYACARHQVTPKECRMHAVKRIFRYLKGHPKLGIWYPKDSPFDLVAYSDSDYGGATQDRKSTTRGCQFLDRRLISWKCKKQTIVATSTTEAEYVAAASGCG
nr:ribonuclease H-like domain, reverse transcriptase, RNA-dependent DNA polymerase [Tanacetum cinerariifolium]